MRRFAATVPATITYCAILLVIGVTVLVFPGFGRQLIAATSTGWAPFLKLGRWWSPLTFFFTTDNVLELVSSVPIAAACIGYAERRLGTWRTLVTGFAAVALGTLAGISIQEIGAGLGEMWSRNVAEFQVVDPFGFIVAVLLAASVYMGSIWRSRVRVVVITVCSVYLLYSGEPSDLYRLLSALAGLGIGMAFHRPTARSRWERSTHHETRVLTAAMVAITAVGPLLTLVSGRRFGPLAPLGLLMSGATVNGQTSDKACDPLNVSRECVRELTLLRLDSAGPAILTFMPLLVLLVAALGISRGRRLGAWLAIVINAGLVVVGTYYYWLLPVLATNDTIPGYGGHYWEEALALAGSLAVPAFLVVFVAVNLRHFQVRSAPGRVKKYLLALVIALVALTAAYLGAGWMLRAQFAPRVSFMDLLLDVPERFIPVSFLRRELIAFLPHSPATALLYNWIGPALWAVVILGALWAYLDSGVKNYERELPRVRALLRRGGGFFSQWATWKGNSYWFSANGDASVAYRVIAGVAITTSEPIGDPEAALGAIPEFARFCDDRGWIPVYYAIHEQYLPAIQHMGWRSMVIGEEAVLRPSTWSTEGKRWQDVRTSINRAERAGVTAVWTEYSDLAPERAEQISRISSEWASGKALPEMGFTLGSIEELRLPEVGLMLACAEDDTILGVTSWLPSYRDGAIIGWTLDFMRRTPAGMNGVMEFLIARCAERFREQGAEFMSLSTAPLATTMSAGKPQTPTDRLLGVLGNVIEPFYGFRSLFRFKQKFQPELMTVSMAYPDALGLPAIGLALARAYVPIITMRHVVGAFRSPRAAIPSTPVEATAPKELA